jgi:outer membrane murein-binding lipoprotein Lpp
VLLTCPLLVESGVLPVACRLKLEGSMKKILVLGSVATSLLLMAGCTSSSSRFVKEDKFEIDHEYVDAVSQAARQMGVRITWVNPPTKRVVEESDISN